MALLKSNLEYAKIQSKKHREFRNFVRGISTDVTKSDYVGHLKEFMNFHNLDEKYNSLSKLKSNEIDVLLEKYIDELEDRGCKSVTIRTKLSGIERFFIMNDCIWHKDRIRLSIKKDSTIAGGREPITTQEISKMLKCTKSLRIKALLLFLASTGVRPGAFVDPVLRMKHLYRMRYGRLSESNDYCYAVKIYADSREEYWGFLTPEATLALDEYINMRKQGGEIIDENSILFRTKKTKSTKVDHITPGNIRYIIYQSFKQTGVTRAKVSNERFDKSAVYGFRKRFNTILKLENSVNSNIAEKLMAHKKGLDGTYLQPTRDECFEEFKKAISELTISNEERQKVKIKKQEDEIADLQKQETEITGLKNENQELRNQQQLIMDELQRQRDYFDSVRNK